MGLPSGGEGVLIELVRDVGRDDTPPTPRKEAKESKGRKSRSQRARGIVQRALVERVRWET